MFGFADTKAAGSAVNSVTPTIKGNTPVDKLARFQEKLEASTGVDKAIQEEIMKVSGNQSVIPCVITSKVSSWLRSAYGVICKMKTRWSKKW